jgi:hypothetical protein
MKSSQKMVVTGGLGGLTAVVVAGSAAFACTAEAGVGVVQAGAMQVNATVPAGSPFTFKVKSFMPATVEKDAAGNEVMVNRRDIIVKLINPYTGEASLIGRYPGPEATVTVPGTVLADAYDSGASKPYILQAEQVGYYSKSSNLYVTNGRPWAPQVGGASTTPGTQASTTPANQVSVVETPAAVGVLNVVAAPAGSANAASVPAATTGTPPSGQPAVAGPALPAPANAAPIVGAPPLTAEEATPPAAELWSGLTAGNATNLLDSATSTAPPSGGVPAGAVSLLGMGILSLAGVAFAATRRRLAVARVTSRR